MSVWRLFRRRANEDQPSIPEGVRIYAIGDVHGRVDLLDGVFSRIDADLATYPVDRPLQVLLGDYVDRGPCSREVIDCLLTRGRLQELVCLKGNHESCLLNFLRNPSTLPQWQQLGGLETLLSYGVVPNTGSCDQDHWQTATAFAAALPTSHREFLMALRSSFTYGDYFFVHAGVRPGIPLSKQKDDDLLWIREDFLLYEQRFEKIIVHGHTPVLQPERRPNRINIDTGAYATGRLTCLKIEGNALFLL
jgi:serine/threonine protein phosphatase 1